MESLIKNKSIKKHVLDCFSQNLFENVQQKQRLVKSRVQSSPSSFGSFLIFPETLGMKQIETRSINVKDGH